MSNCHSCSARVRFLAIALWDLNYLINFAFTSVHVASHITFHKFRLFSDFGDVKRDQHQPDVKEVVDQVNEMFEFQEQLQISIYLDHQK